MYPVVSDITEAYKTSGHPVQGLKFSWQVPPLASMWFPSPNHPQKLTRTFWYASLSLHTYLPLFPPPSSSHSIILSIPLSIYLSIPFSPSLLPSLSLILSLPPSLPLSFPLSFPPYITIFFVLFESVEN